MLSIETLVVSRFNTLAVEPDQDPQVPEAHIVLELQMGFPQPLMSKHAKLTLEVAEQLANTWLEEIKRLRALGKPKLKVHVAGPQDLEAIRRQAPGN
jgi:hypothetical protein